MLQNPAQVLLQLTAPGISARGAISIVFHSHLGVESYDSPKTDFIPASHLSRAYSYPKSLIDVLLSVFAGNRKSLFFIGEVTRARDDAKRDE